VRQRLILADAGGAGADDDAQLHFPSVLWLFLGIMTSSWGPLIAPLALRKTIGSFGMAAPVSAAWSA
jgi:hypothetical protein